ncbi:MAG: cytochrome c biogenesis protein CcdA [Candidatus Omnitrophota bacterium]
MDQVSLGIAFLAGILSFLSPCVLPLVPGYISFLSGVSLEELKQGSTRGRVLRKAALVSVFFVMGFSVIFVAMGASASFIGKLLADHIVVMTKVAGVVIVVLGLHLVGVLRLGWLNYQKHFEVKKFSPGFLGAFLIGMAFGFGWTPCVGPILAGILALAAAQKTLVKGMFLLAAYSLGLGIPFIITAFAVGVFMRFFERYKRFIRWGQAIAGVLLIVMGVLIFFDSLGIVLELPELIRALFYRFTA